MTMATMDIDVDRRNTPYERENDFQDAFLGMRDINVMYDHVYRLNILEKCERKPTNHLMDYLRHVIKKSKRSQSVLEACLGKVIGAKHQANQALSDYLHSLPEDQKVGNAVKTLTIWNQSNYLMLWNYPALVNRLTHYIRKDEQFFSVAFPSMHQIDQMSAEQLSEELRNHFSAYRKPINDAIYAAAQYLKGYAEYLQETLLSSYRWEIPTRVPISIPSELSGFQSCLQGIIQDTYSDYLKPVYASGRDSNCLFQSCMLAISGTENRAPELRVRAIVSLILEPRYLEFYRDSEGNTDCEGKLTRIILNAVQRGNPTHDVFLKVAADMIQREIRLFRQYYNEHTRRHEIWPVRKIGFKPVNSGQKHINSPPIYILMCNVQYFNNSEEPSNGKQYKLNHMSPLLRTSKQWNEEEHVRYQNSNSNNRFGGRLCMSDDNTMDKLSDRVDDGVVEPQVSKPICELPANLFVSKDLSHDEAKQIEHVIREVEDDLRPIIEANKCNMRGKLLDAVLIEVTALLQKQAQKHTEPIAAIPIHAPEDSTPSASPSRNFEESSLDTL